MFNLDNLNKQKLKEAWRLYSIISFYKFLLYLIIILSAKFTIWFLVIFELITYSLIYYWINKDLEKYNQLKISFEEN